MLWDCPVDDRSPERRHFQASLQKLMLWMPHKLTKDTYLSE